MITKLFSVTDFGFIGDNIEHPVFIDHKVCSHLSLYGDGVISIIVFQLKIVFKKSFKQTIKVQNGDRLWMRAFKKTYSG